jgi:hypothetical protein
MSARDELAAIIDDRWHGYGYNPQGAADAVIAAGWRPPARTIETWAELEALPFGSAVQTSDDSDTVVLRCEGRDFRNQSGAEVSVETLWRYGTHPFTVIYEP